MSIDWSKYLVFNEILIGMDWFCLSLEYKTKMARSR